MHALEAPLISLLAVQLTALLPLAACSRVRRATGGPRGLTGATEDLAFCLPDVGSFSAPAVAVALAGNATRVLQAGLTRAGAAVADARTEAEIASATSKAATSSHEKDDGMLTEEASKLLPIVWLHIPKTGSSFATTLAHFGCPDIPMSVTVKEVSWKNPFNKSALNVPFNKKYPPSIWCPHSFARFESGHSPVPVWAEYEHVVSMFREPKTRLVSGYFHNYHDCPQLRSKCFCPGENMNCQHLYRTPMWRQRQRLKEYHECVNGCQAHMLTGELCGVHGTSQPASDEPAKTKALAAVDRMGFVGLTEEWPMSVCLFHRRFGGDCVKASFKNVRPGHAKHRYAAFVDMVDWSMGIDDALYSAAHRRFWKDIAAHGVTPKRCRTEICPAAAEFFEDNVKFELEGDDDDI